MFGRIRRKDFLVMVYFHEVWKEGREEVVGRVVVDLCSGRPETAMEKASVVLLAGS